MAALDPIPTFLVKELVDVLLPYVTAMVNASLRDGWLPPWQKHAVVTPVMKKSGLDADVAGVTGRLLHRLQVIQNAAAQCSPCYRATKYEHMTPVLRSLHWLPVRHRITFKIAVTVYKCLHSMVPPYLAEYCTLTSFDAGRRHLRSAYTRQLIVPRTRTSYGDRSFAVHGPVVWNSLPHDLRSTDISLATFRNRLKTFLFDSDK